MHKIITLDLGCVNLPCKFFCNTIKIPFELRVKDRQLCVNPISPGGEGGLSPPGRLSLTAQDINMKFFKFNLTLMGVILHITTILINLRCCYGNLLL